MTAGPLRILVASDKFKGSLTGPEACAAIADGLRDALGSAAVEIRSLPVADGGEGMARAITEARGGQWIESQASDPLGRPVTAGYGWIESDRTAVIEMAEASGLWRLSAEERDPWRASTRGTGDLIRHAIGRGAHRLLLGIGGSSTNDGGTGMAEALGFRFLDRNGTEITGLPEGLERVVRIDSGEAPPLPAVSVACDVTNPLLGPDGCTRIYGPQKGISPDNFERHETRLRHLVDLMGDSGAAAATAPGSGAAGGLGFGSMVFLGATLIPGFDLVAESLGLEQAVREADLVITGEGRLDAQTLQGKAPAGVADLARRLGKPVAAFAGVVDPDAGAALAERFALVAPLDRDGLSLDESIRQAAALLRQTAARHAPDLVALGRPGR